MGLSFTTNLIVCFLDPIEISVSNEIGVAILICGFLIFVYVLLYLRSGFFRETRLELDFIIKEGPYRFCRYPQYLSFIIIIFGIDLMFRSPFGIVITITLAILSLVYRAKIEDRLLKKKFGTE